MNTSTLTPNSIKANEKYEVTFCNTKYTLELVLVHVDFKLHGVMVTRPEFAVRIEDKVYHPNYADVRKHGLIKMFKYYEFHDNGDTLPALLLTQLEKDLNTPPWSV